MLSLKFVSVAMCRTTCQEADRRENCIKYNKEEYRLWQRAKGEEFRVLPEDQKLRERLEGNMNADVSDEEVLDRQAGTVLQSIVSSVGTSRTP